MHGDRFDELARALANGASRRQALKWLVGGVTGGVLAFFGFGSRRTGAPVAIADGSTKLFLPVVVSLPSICPVASTCDAKQYCSADQTCRCIKSAEGDIRCGKVPSCSIQHCTTSADCTSLGAGYFCDTPFSGCCSDNQLQRCIAPCDNPSSCPPARICGSVCCPEGQTCVNGTCTQPALETWDGTTTYNTQTLGVHVLLQIDPAGNLSGHMYVLDPITSAQVDAGTVAGTVQQNHATWTSPYTNQSVNGTFAGNSFTGTMQFPAIDPDPAFVANLSLTRTVVSSAPPASAVRGHY